MEVRAIPLEVAVEGKLRHEEDLAVDVHDAPVPRLGAVPILRAPLAQWRVSREQASAEALPRDVLRILLGVVAAYAHEDHEPGADGRYHRAVHGDGRALDPLNDRSHARPREAK